MTYDPTSPDFAPSAHQVYRELRDHHPVFVGPEGRFHALSRFADVLQASTDWERFSSTGKQESQYIKITMNSLDPPRHTQMRALIARGFTPRRVKELEGDIRTIARDLLDQLGDGGSADLIHDYAGPLPSMVMGRLIGIPDELVPVCRALTDEFMHHTAPQDSEGPASKAYEIFAELLEARRRRPQDDLLSALLAAEVDGVRLTEDELLGFGWLLLVGGNDTTTNLIGNGIELFARHPDERRRVLDDPELLGPAVEEVLRLASPTHTLPRRAACDIELHGTTIPEGSRVLLLWGAANLDEREFADPERFDVGRRAPRHLALGHGPHYCLGASLTRLEARIAWEELLRRMPRYELTATPVHFTSSTFYGFESLPVAVEPVGG